MKIQSLLKCGLSMMTINGTTANKSIATSGADGSCVLSVSAFIGSGSGLTSNVEQKYKLSTLISIFIIGWPGLTQQQISHLQQYLVVMRHPTKHPTNHEQTIRHSTIKQILN
jgi:hypothetical protein